MKKIIFIAAVCATMLAKAQTTAQDWTKNDCDGNSHHLFAELNAGNVIILEYVMMDCAPCITAANGLKPVYNQFNSSHPGKVKSYSIGFTDTYTCTQLQNWKSTNNLSHTTMFPTGASDVSYYGGMGMPTIVVVGGPFHKVFYKKQGYSPSDNTTITAAINSALVATAVETPASIEAFQVYPNPASTFIDFQLNEDVHMMSINDLSGRTMANFTALSSGKHHLNLDLKAGIYFVSVSTSNGSVQRQKLIIR